MMRVAPPKQRRVFRRDSAEPAAGESLTVNGSYTYFCWFRNQ